MLVSKAVLGPRSGVERPVQLHHVCHLQVRTLAAELRAAAAAGVGPGDGRGDGLQRGGVALGDADAVLRQEALGPVDALRAELVVPKGPQQLTDDDICLPRRLPRAHVPGHDLYAGPGLFRAPAVAQGVHRIRVLVHSPDADRGVRAASCPQRGGHKRPAASTQHHDCEWWRPSCSKPLAQERKHGLLVLRVLDWIRLEQLVGLGLEIVLQRLQRSLQAVKVRLRKALDSRQGWQRLKEPGHITQARPQEVSAAVPS
mmetsp:Transcript_52135/g.151505  ORF Transcript_52135/g.151505 Transcript_52135/m.151505 type:complete len:257 (+) Transcript_52135:435-1205(+)